jgi:pimeloyl-ACP methyl ester carboxylesterase
MYRSPQEIAAPTLVLWGERDPFLSRRLLNHFRPWVPDLRIERLATSHWIQNDAPVQVNALLADFFRDG